MIQYQCIQMSPLISDVRCNIHTAINCGLFECASRTHQSIYRTIAIKDKINSYSVSINAANIADIPHVVVNFGFSISQLGKGINNNTEEDIQHCDDNRNVERAIK